MTKTTTPHVTFAVDPVEVGRELLPTEKPKTCILPHDNICEDEGYTVCFADPEEVKQVAAAIAGIDREEMRRRYDAIDHDEYAGHLSDDDFEYTWGWFVPLREFFNKAAAHDRAVIFTVDS